MRTTDVMRTLDVLRRREVEGGRCGTVHDGYSLGFTPDQLRSLGRIRGQKGLFMHDGCVNTVKWNARGNLLVTGSDDRCLKVWDTADYGNVRLKHTVRTNFRDNILYADFVPGTNDRSIVSCSVDGSIHLYDIERPDFASMLVNSREKIHGFLFWKEHAVEDPTSMVMFTAQEDGKVVRYDLREPFGGTGTSIMLEGSIPIKSLAMPSVRACGYEPWQIAVGGLTSSVEVFDLRRGIPVNPLGPKTDCIQEFVPKGFSLRSSRPNLQSTLSDLGVSGMTYSYDGRKLLVSYQGAQIYSFPTDDYNKCVNESVMYGGHINYDTYLKSVSYYGPRDEYVVSGSDSGHIWFWDEKTANVELLLKADASIANGVIPHPHDSALCSYGIDSDAKLWLTGTHQGPPELDGRFLEELLETNALCVLHSQGHCVTVDAFLGNLKRLRRRPADRADVWPNFPRDLPISTLSDPEKLKNIAEQIKTVGNDYFKEGQHEKARDKYVKAKAYLVARTAAKLFFFNHQHWSLNEVNFGDCELWNRDDESEVRKLKISCVLNQAQCELVLGNQRETIKLCTDVLDVDDENPKAYYRRGMAYLDFGRSLSDLEKAVSDLNRACELAPSDSLRLKCASARNKRAQRMQLKTSQRESLRLSDSDWQQQHRSTTYD